jgi:hypothetical protein
MDTYSEYISALKDSEVEGDKYYATRAKEKMSNVRDLVNQISNFSYAW